jgi:hypothetical protein
LLLVLLLWLALRAFLLSDSKGSTHTVLPLPAAAQPQWL